MKRYPGLIAAGLLFCLPAMAQAGAHGGMSPAGTPPNHPPVGETQSQKTISGKVVETMDAGGYTYALLEKEGGEKLWFAVPATKIVKGSQVSFQPGMEMPNFSSKALNKTFDKIIFSGGLASSATEAGKESPGAKGAVVNTAEKIKVEKATGANAHVIEELYKKSAALDGKKVTVKGKVVKFTSGIMSRNWVHLRDGSGDQAKGTHNLVVTTQTKAAVGDIVTITGTLKKDRDFGGGYKYAIIVEEAEIKK